MAQDEAGDVGAAVPTEADLNPAKKKVLARKKISIRKVTLSKKKPAAKKNAAARKKALAKEGASAKSLAAGKTPSKPPVFRGDTSIRQQIEKGRLVLARQGRNRIAV